MSGRTVKSDDAPFTPQYKAVVECDGLDSGGRPTGSYELKGFRHKDDLPIAEWPPLP